MSEKNSAMADRIQLMRARFDVLFRHYQFDARVRSMRDSKDDATILRLLPELYALWGTPLSRSAQSFLQSCIAHAKSCSGHVLQCGSSLDTLVLGIVCARQPETKTHLWCLEHDQQRANLIRSWLTDYGISSVHVIVARPQMFADHVWYKVDTSQLPKNFSLAVCEGGHSTPRGVVGLIAKMQDKMGDDSVILAQHVREAKDHEYLTQWATEHKSNCVLVDRTEGFFKISSATTKSPAAA
jgi:hypothetical protein